MNKTRMKAKFRRIGAMILIVLISMSILGALSTPGFSIDYVSSNVVEYGDILTVMGSGVTAGTEVKIFWDYAHGILAHLLNTTEVNPDGTFECEIRVPSDVFGAHYLWATDVATGETVSYGPITMVPKMNLSPKWGSPGSEITIMGYGFSVDEDVILTIGGVYLGNFTTDNFGWFSGKFTVPAIAFEVYKLRAEQPAHGIVVEVNFKVGLIVVIISPTSGKPGDIITITGVGFTPGGKWRAVIDGLATIISWEDVDSNGFLEIDGATPTFKVPLLDSGKYNITILDDETGIFLKVEFEVLSDPHTHEIHLFMGWNLIGLPCTPEDPSIEVVLSDILDNVESVWTFIGETKTWSSYAPGAPSDLTEMVDDKGYWINMKIDAILKIYERAEGIIDEVEGPVPGTKSFIYTTDEYQIAVIVPTYLEVSMSDNKSKSEIYVYLKPLVSLSGTLSVDMEFGVKVKFPIFGIYLFTDVDVTIFGIFKPDIIQMEWLVYGVSLQYIDLEEGDVGLYSITIPTKSGIVSLESLTVGEWKYVAAYDIYTVMEPTAVSLGLIPDEITVQLIELVVPVS